jgi:hypothetical protein
VDRCKQSVCKQAIDRDVYRAVSLVEHAHSAGCRCFPSSFASRRMCGRMLAAWRQVLPVAIEHGVRDMPHAKMLLVRTFVLPRALYACQVWGPVMLQLSPCGQSSLQSELLPNSKRVLGLRGSVAQGLTTRRAWPAANTNHLAESMCEFFAAACTASRGSPLLWEAMRAIVELSRDCHKAWCARLAWFSIVLVY